ncbi:hypothetical protein PALB_19100 [Pseudoalteromonas luteoviolacea B = ATCC 29581]|nr:hypothetical protein PALB_19100 [Pseudoalteromonas luteoviolacea B = ATCC 29581]
MKLKAIYCALVLTQVTACGGGSEANSYDGSVNPPTGTNPPVNKDMTVTSSVERINLGESEEVTFTLTAHDETGTLSVDLSQYAGIGSVSSVINGSIISVTYSLPVLNNNASEDIPITVKDSDDEIAFSVPVSAINTSGEIILNKVKVLRNTIEQQTVYNDILLAAKSYSAMQYLNGEISKSTSIKQSESLASAKSESFMWGFDVYMDVNVGRIDERIANYQNSEIAEPELETLFYSIRDKLTNGAAYLIEAANEIAEQSGNTSPFPSYIVSASSLGVSGFIGNEQYGSWEGDTWVFKQEYQLLNQVVTSPCYIN